MEKNDKKVEIGKKLREVREKMGKSQESVALDVGISVSALCKIERGKSDVKLSTFLKLVHFLNVSPNAILRAEVDDTKTLYDDELHELVKDCSPEKLADILVILKKCVDLSRKDK